MTKHYSALSSSSHLYPKPEPPWWLDVKLILAKCAKGIERVSLICVIHDCDDVNVGGIFWKELLGCIHTIISVCLCETPTLKNS